MREIKFRGKSNRYENWLFGSLWIDKEDFYIVHERKSEKADGSSSPYVTGVAPDTIGQYTGLKDKNGTEIYEGDIVEAWSAGSYLTGGIVKWGQGTARFFIGNKQNSICWNLSGGGASYEQETLEIIGNIHDNPELIK